MKGLTLPEDEPVPEEEPDSEDAGEEEAGSLEGEEEGEMGEELFPGPPEQAANIREMATRKKDCFFIMFSLGMKRA